MFPEAFLLPRSDSIFVRCGGASPSRLFSVGFLCLSNRSDQFQEVGTESHRNPQKESLSCAETVPAEEPLSSSLSASTESSLPVKSFVVSSRSGPFNSWSVCSIVIEKGILHKTVGKERNEKRESVPLADCIFAHSTLESDKRRPYCVSITSQQSSFSLLLSFENRAQEEEFLSVLQEYHK